MAQFQEIISNRGSSLVMSLVNKINDISSEANLEDEEKTDFSNGQTKVRRKLEQKLRLFREYLDLEANKW